MIIQYNWDKDTVYKRMPVRQIEVGARIRRGGEEFVLFRVSRGSDGIVTQDMSGLIIPNHFKE